jgi:PKD repeat protein
MKHFLLCAAFVATGLMSGLNAQVTLNQSGTSGCAPYTVTFTATVTGGYNYTWYFDCCNPVINTSSVMNHTYTTPWYSAYTAQVYVTDINGNYLGYAQSMGIQVSGADDSLHTENNNPCVGDIIVLDIGQTQNPSNINWDFDDGSYYNNVNYYGVQHIYLNPGTYYPKAIVTTSCGIDTLTQVITVSNTGTFPTNVWTNVPVDSVCPGDPFTIFPSYMYPNYLINWGDGNYSTNHNSHAYASVGTYAVTITYFNGCGNSLSQTYVVFVGNNLPVPVTPAIDFRPDSTCVNSPVSLYPYPAVYSSYSWNFGGNDTSLTETAVRSFSSVGNHPLTLTVTNGCGYSVTVSDTVKVVSSLQLPTANVTITPSTICPGDAIYTRANVNQGSDEDFTFKWDYGDGNNGLGKETSHSYSSTGTYTVTMTLENTCGNTQSYNSTVVVGNNVIPDSAEYQYSPVPFTQGGVTACLGDSVVFVFVPVSAQDTVFWDFGDMTSAYATTQIVVNGGTYRLVKHAYSANGIYQARVTFKNGCGNSFTAYSPVKVVVGSNNGIQESKIFFDESAYHCQGKDVDFYAFGGSSYLWNFGDGSGNLISYNTLVPVHHAFQSPGQFMVTCVATNGCGYSVTDTVYITIPPSHISITANTVNSHCGVNDGKAIAVADGGTIPYTYQWSNGNSTFLADSLTSGIYVVTVTDVHGCSNFSIATVSDQQAPVITVSTVIPVSCFGSNNGAIDINLIGNSGPYTYLWSNGATSQDIYQLVSGPYEVSVTDANGCVATRSIYVGQPPEVVLSTQSSPASCGSNNGSAGVAVSGTTGPYAYIWSNGGNTQIVNGLTSGIYTVTVVDNNGCIYNTDVAVNEANGPVIVLDSITGTGCGNNLASIYIHPVLGTAPFTYSWSTGATTQNLSGVAVGTYTVVVTSNDGCKSTREVSITKDDPAGTSICIVTVDTITGMNRVVVVKDTSLTNISGYNIYKESTMSGLYYLVGNIPFSSQATAWTDSLSDSKVRSWRYKVTVVDNCGGESELSTEHKTIHLNTNAGINNSYNLIWDQYEGFSFSQYAIYRFDQSNGWVFLTYVPNNIMSYTDLTPPTNTLAYMVDAVSNSSCSDSSARYSAQSPLAAINNSHSNIKNLFAVPGGMNDNLPFGPEFSLYPNPTSGLTTLAYPFSSSGYTVNVCNALGEVVYSFAISAGESQLDRNVRTLDLSRLSKGVYTVSFESVSGRIHKKLILQ